MADAIYPAYGRDKRLALLVDGPAGTEFVGDLAAGSATVTNIADTSGISVGDKIYLTLVDGSAPKTVLSKTSTTIVLSALAGTTQAAQPMVAYPPSTGSISLQGKDIRFYDSSLSPSVATTLANLVAAEITIPGFTPPAGVWTLGFVNAGGQAIAESQTVEIHPSGVVSPPVSVGGAWTDDGVGALVIWPLDNEVTLSDVVDVLKVMLTDAYPTPGALIQILP